MFDQKSFSLRLFDINKLKLNKYVNLSQLVSFFDELNIQEYKNKRSIGVLQRYVVVRVKLVLVFFILLFFDVLEFCQIYYLLSLVFGLG